MAADILFIALSLAVILLSCALFTNAVEWFGKALGVSQGVVGSVFAAVGTALPETIIPIIAILVIGDEKSKEIGVGAIAGAPFMLATLAFFITGLAVIAYALTGRRGFKINADSRVISRDLSFFLVIYIVAVSTTFIRQYALAKGVVAAALFVSYFVYIRFTFSDQGGEGGEELKPLLLGRLFKTQENLVIIIIQLGLALAGIILGSRLFIARVESLSEALGVAPLIISIIITPIATELPEKFNSIIWMGEKKDTLALGNITGAMVFQSCIPVAFGVAFTEWNLAGVTMVSAVLAIVSAGLVFLWVKLKAAVNPFALLLGGVFYAALLFYIFGGGNT